MILLRLYKSGRKRQKEFSKKYLIIDSEDYVKIRHLRLSVSFHHNKYVNREKIHRIIKNVKIDEIVDHINGDSLDNRKCNLRICNNKQNLQNRSKNKGKCFKGTYKANENLYYARINQQIIGKFDNEIDAAKCYDEHAKKLFGEFACLNYERHDVLDIYDGNGDVKLEFEKFIISQDEHYINEYNTVKKSKNSYESYLKKLKENKMCGWRML